jgi:hypothetical protein
MEVKASTRVGAAQADDAEVDLYQLISNIHIFEVTYRGTLYIRKWVFLGTPYFRSYGFF